MSENYFKTKKKREELVQVFKNLNSFNDVAYIYNSNDNITTYSSNGKNGVLLVQDTINRLDTLEYDGFLYLTKELFESIVEKNDKKEIKDYIESSLKINVPGYDYNRINDIIENRDNYKLKIRLNQDSIKSIVEHMKEYKDDYHAYFSMIVDRNQLNSDSSIDLKFKFDKFNVKIDSKSYELIDSNINTIRIFFPYEIISNLPKIDGIEITMYENNKSNSLNADTIRFKYLSNDFLYNFYCYVSKYE